MNTNETISTVYGAQRDTIIQSREALEQSVELQKQASAVLTDWFDAGRVAQQRGLTVAKTTLDAYFNAAEATIPGSSVPLKEVRQASDEGFDRAADVQEDIWDEVERAAEDGVDSYEAIADAYLDAADSTFDTYLDSHERAEGRVVAAADIAAEPVDVEIDG